MSQLCILGSSLDDYEVLRPLGRGAYSYVYQVKFRETQEEFALKVVDKDRLKQQRLTRRLQNEIAIQQILNHPNILKLHHSFEDDEHVYILLELCTGGDLYNYIKESRRSVPVKSQTMPSPRDPQPILNETIGLEEDECKHLCTQLISGVQYLHSLGIFHRDLKLGNLLLSEDRTQLKIADFGLAVKLENSEEERNTLCGTPNYLSPQDLYREVINRQPYGLSSDLWAIGCIIYACLIGHPPFESASVQNTLLKVKDMNYALPASLSPEAKHLIVSLLSWDPKERLSLSQIADHPFISPQRHMDCSYYEYTETISTPKKQKNNLTVINTSGLPPLKHQVQRGTVEITDSGWVIVEFAGKKLEVSGDGMTILYQNKIIPLHLIQGSARKLYEYTCNLIEVVKSKTPKITLSDRHGQYMLMRNNPPNFEAIFVSGARVEYQLGNDRMLVYLTNGEQLEVSTYSSVEQLDRRVQGVVELVYEGLKRCLRHDSSNVQQKFPLQVYNDQSVQRALEQAHQSCHFQHHTQ